ncbi:hypothetical protein [Streptomyces sp. NBC_01497]|uniref:hypothetical protein n=1 Tax=Streptomyces sp. NBC_01497 TaxID=2903885 RepID=UPI002E34A88D|nr:hypothetical protein [Streptomyces sp. NBC_01497]
MADSTEATTEDIEPGQEVEAHSAKPLGLQEMGVRAPGQDSLLVATSTTSVISCE